MDCDRPVAGLCQTDEPSRNSGRAAATLAKASAASSQRLGKQLQVGQGLLLLRDHHEVGGAGVEEIQGCHGAVQEGDQEPQLREHQDDGEPDTGESNFQAAEVVPQILPGQRYAGRATAHRKSSAGSAR